MYYIHAIVIASNNNILTVTVKSGNSPDNQEIIIIVNTFIKCLN